jgi:Protein of unknown function (DUF3467)
MPTKNSSPNPNAEPLAGVTFETKDIPTFYANHASPAMSFNDIRVYFSEVVPKEMTAAQTVTAVRSQPTIRPKICVVVSPEFAKALSESLKVAVGKYESVFGPMRTPPSTDQVNSKLGQ